MEISFGAFGGAGFSRTPIGLAIRDCINNAVDWMLITSFPDEKEKFMAAAAARNAVGQKPGAGARNTARSGTGADTASATDGIAAIDDVNAVPGLDERGRESYRKWLQASLPRAFVIHSSGGWHFAPPSAQGKGGIVTTGEKRGREQTWFRTLAAMSGMGWEADICKVS